MTAARLQTIRNLIGHVPHVFAADGLRSDPSANSDGSTSINWASGIPPSYAEMEQDGGKRALLADLNCIGSLSSRELYLWQHGGYHTFDMRVANLIGGYGFGAILDWWQNETGLLRKVRCIKEGGNCFTPLDDPDHGVESSDPHWQIVDMIGQSTFTMSSVAETEIPDPYYDFVFRGTNVLWLQVTPFTPGQTYYTNTWIAPADVKIVADSLFADRSGTMWTSSRTYTNLPNPLFYGWDANSWTVFDNGVTLTITPPGGAKPLSLKISSLSPLGTYTGRGPSLGPIYLPKGTTMQVAVPTRIGMRGHEGFAFNFKFKAYKV